MLTNHRYILLSLTAIKNTGWAVGHRHSQRSGRYSKHIQFGYKVVDQPWKDQHHLHTESEEWYIVLQGKLKIEIGGRSITVGPRQVLGVRARVQHRVVGGEGPIEEFSIRVPSVRDKKVLE